MGIRKKVLLIIMDGLGVAPASKGNAVVLANAHTLSSLWSTSPHTYLLASGEAVGLPKEVKGNSEVGHMNIGAGRVVIQTLPRIDQAIQKGLFFKNNTLLQSLQHTKKYNSRIHLISLLSEGGVHAHTNHMISTLEFFTRNNLSGEIYIHAFTDGRDSPVNDATRNLDRVQRYINQSGIGKIATLCGRSWAMDRNHKWERTKKAYDLLTRNIGEKCSTYNECLIKSYERNISDEFVNPTVLVPDSEIRSGDTVLFLNFRPDRALQLTRALIEEGFNKFERVPLSNIFFASMVEYRKGFPKNILFPKQYIDLPIGNILASNGLKQLRISESEKFPHVTYFFNGGTNVKYSGEDRVLVQSPQVPTYDLQPEMSAVKMTDILVERIRSDIYDFIVVNFANPDMVAHSGNIEATIRAVKTVDTCVNRLVKEFNVKDGITVITSDHGNAEELINLDTNEMDTEHSYNPVPLVVAGNGLRNMKLQYGSLKDISPTILHIMGISIPNEMTGKSLLPSSSFNTV